MKEYKYTINGNKYAVTIENIEGNIAKVKVNGENYTVEMPEEEESDKPKTTIRPAQPATQAPTAAAPEKKPASRDAVKAPLPGVITEIRVNVGDEVKKGDTIVVLEAMKMANNLEAESDGKVSAIYVNAGQSVMEGDPLVLIE